MDNEICNICQCGNCKDWIYCNRCTACKDEKQRPINSCDAFIEETGGFNDECL